MQKQICSLLVLSALLSISTYVHAEELGFFEKRLYNPAFIYRYRTSQGRMIALDVRQLTALMVLPMAGMDENTSKNDPRVLYALITMPVFMVAGLWSLYQDWRGCIGDAVVQFPLLAGLSYLNIEPHIAQGLIYGSRALYSEKILPWSYEGEDDEGEDTMDFAE